MTGLEAAIAWVDETPGDWQCEGCGEWLMMRVPRLFFGGMHYCLRCARDIENARRF